MKINVLELFRNSEELAPLYAASTAKMMMRCLNRMSVVEKAGDILSEEEESPESFVRECVGILDKIEHTRHPDEMVLVAALHVLVGIDGEAVEELSREILDRPRFRFPWAQRFAEIILGDEKHEVGTGDARSAIVRLNHECERLEARYGGTWLFNSDTLSVSCEDTVDIGDELISLCAVSRSSVLPAWVATVETIDGRRGTAVDEDIFTCISSAVLSIRRRSRSDNGFFLVIEGLDGSGTTTQTQAVAEVLSGRGPVSTTMEPTEGALGKGIREILAGQSELRRPDGQIEEDLMALLFAADRIDHRESTLKPHLKEGALVVSDRYDLSSYAYQTEGPKDLSWVRALNERALEPDLTVFLDVPVQTCLDRLDERDARDVYENEDFLRRIDARYRKVVEVLQEEGRYFAIVDGTKAPDAVTDAIVTEVNKRLS